MKANELRIGNWILSDDKIVRVMDIHSFTNGEFKNNDGRFGAFIYDGIFEPREMSAGCNLFEPIPLTEEWLLKFGFEKIITPTLLKEINITYYKKGNFIIYLLKNSFEVELINQNGEQFNLYINWEKHVHTLQNLYFALTGEELTRKETVA